MASLQSLYLTLQSGEGFSVNADHQTFKGRGYAVGGTAILPLVEDNYDLSFNKFADAVKTMTTLIHDTDTQVIGGWIGDDGKAYVEVSDVVRSEFVAMELAISRNEIAIYDFQNQKEIRNPHFVSGVTTTKVKVPARQTETQTA